MSNGCECEIAVIPINEAVAATLAVRGVQKLRPSDRLLPDDWMGLLDQLYGSTATASRWCEPEDDRR